MTLGSTYTIGLKTCSANQVLQYSGTVWACASAGTGTVTSVASGAGLTGGPITKTGTLSIATGGVTNVMLQHSTLTVTAGSGLSGGGSVALGGSTSLSLNSAVVPGAGHYERIHEHEFDQRLKDQPCPLVVQYGRGRPRRQQRRRRRDLHQ